MADGAGGGDAPIPDKTVLLYAFGPDSSECGYCDKKSGKEGRRTLRSFVAESMTCSDYQNAIDRGWRRSGTYLYLPDNVRSCCPNFTIRLDVDRFRMSKSQRKVLARTAGRAARYFSHLCGTDAAVSGRASGAGGETSNVGSESAASHTGSPPAAHESIARGMAARNVNPEASAASECKSALAEALSKFGLELPAEVRIRFSPLRGGMSGYVCSSVCVQLAHVFKRDSLLDKLGVADVPSAALALAKEVASCLEAAGTTAISKVTAMENGYVAGCVLTTHEGGTDFKLAKQTKRHGVECLPRGVQPAIECSVVPSRFEMDSFRLYQRYQVAVHGDTIDDVSRKQYTGFLVDSPLISSASGGGGDSCAPAFGSFHFRYSLYGKLIAVGVVDVLPLCLSSVYVFYDPDLPLLELGKYTALQEIEWVQKASAAVPSLHYYYMGYYVHNCSKMRYKAEYKPSDLLCPFHHEWIALSNIQKTLDEIRVFDFCKMIE